MKDETRGLSMGELDGVSGGAPNTSAPPKKTAPPKTGKFEINDFSFDVELVPH
jgi:hypothetical protein